MSEYAYGNGRLLSKTSTQKEESLIDYYRNKDLNNEHFSLDTLGSVSMITGVNGQVIEEYGYDVFGRVYDGSLTGGNRFGYNGKPIDSETGLYNYGFRDYAPRQMRFTTIDPIKDSQNWYGYVGNDPGNFVDQLGLSSESDNSAGNRGFDQRTAEIMAGAEILAIGADIIFMAGAVAAEIGAYTGAAAIVAGGTAVAVGVVGVGVILIGIDLIEGDGLDHTSDFLGMNND